MENDVLKNRIAPWQEKGRWYHAHLTETGIDTNNTDEFIITNMAYSISGNLLSGRNGNFCIIDYVFRINNSAVGGGQAIRKEITIHSDRSMSASIFRADQYTSIDADVWLFINVRR